MTPFESLSLAGRISASVAPLENRFALAAACVMRREGKAFAATDLVAHTGADAHSLAHALRLLAAAEAINDNRGPLLSGPVERVDQGTSGPDRYRIREGHDDDPAMRAFLAVVDAVKHDLDHRHDGQAPAAEPAPDLSPKKSRQ